MSLVGFPNKIQVTLGSAFDGSATFNGLNSGNVLVLTDVGNGYQWTESGSITPNPTTNRLLFIGAPDGATTGGVTISAVVAGASGSNTWWFGGTLPGFIAVFQGTTVDTYNFKDIWTGVGPSSTMIYLTTTGGTPASNSSVLYNPQIFSAMDEYSESVTCWEFTAKYFNSDRLFKLNGPNDAPDALRIPKNVDTSTGTMIEHGKKIKLPRFL